MMNLRFKLGHVLVLCLVLSMALGESIRGAEPDTHIDRLARAYRAARTDSERRAVCLEAIYARKLPPSHELDWGVVHFRPSPPSPSDKVAAAYVGWYLAFQLDSAGTLQNYYLSNVHK
jgi:hypothetical protein